MGTALGSSAVKLRCSLESPWLRGAAVFPASIKAVAEWFPKKRTRTGHWDF